MVVFHVSTFILLLQSKDVNAIGTELGEFTGNLKKTETSEVYYIKGVMQTTAGNDYQGLTLDGISITVVATQDTVENDSFGNTYDEKAEYPTVITTDNIEDELSTNKKTINAVLSGDVTFDVREWQEKPMGGEDTETITIDGQGHKLTFNNINSNWNNVIFGNAKLTIKNAVIDNSGYNANKGTWDSHDITFRGNVKFQNVTFTNAVAIDGTAVFENVKISDENAEQDTYMLWICAGSNVTLENVTINGKSATGHANRAIAIKDQYIDNPGMTTLSINGAKISSDTYAAVLVTSTGGANITMKNVDISETKDTTNAVWYDGNGENITVKGCTKKAR